MVTKIGNLVQRRDVNLMLLELRERAGRLVEQCVQARVRECSQHGQNYALCPSALSEVVMRDCNLHKTLASPFATVGVVHMFLRGPSRALPSRRALARDSADAARR